LPAGLPCLASCVLKHYYASVLNLVESSASTYLMKLLV